MKLAYKISFWFTMIYTAICMFTMVYTCAVVWGAEEMLWLIGIWIVAQCVTIKLQIEMYRAQDPIKEIE